MSADEPTVVLDISVEISQHDPEYDTGIPLSVWNAMTNDERGEIANQAWVLLAERDDGGCSVVTPGAEPA